MPPEGLAKWLRSLPEDELVSLLGRRPDALAGPAPRSFAELADRLSTPHSVHAALENVDRAGWQLIELLQSLGGQAPTSQLYEVLGEGVPPDVLRRVMDAVQALGLAWSSSTGNSVRLVGPLRHQMDHPLGLGRPVAELLPPLTVDQLAVIGDTYGHRGQRRKSDWITLLTGLLTDADAVRDRLAQLPAEARRLADDLAWHGPVVHGQVALALSRYGGRGSVTDPVLLLGWVLPTGWGDTGEMPREVALAIRGPDYHPPLDADPPQVSTMDVHSGQALVQARAAVQSTVDGVRRLVEFLGRTPIATLRSGGVGVRELTKASRTLRCKETELRLWLETLANAKMVTIVGQEVLPTEAADVWSAAEPADGLVTLLQAWYDAPRLALDNRTDDGKPAPALRYGGGQLATSLRRDVLAVLMRIAPAGVASVRSVTEQLAWQRPLRYGSAERLQPAVDALWTELQLLGLVADGAITPLGQALGGVESQALREAAADLLPAPANEATFLPDLTAVVAGAPSVQLAALLNAAADQESRDAASSWRFSPASVRRALDAGTTADGLLTGLQAVASRPLPQPLTYLVRDVARRHGQLRVVPVNCCVLAADQALATEIASHRALAGLQLRILGGTVLASTKPVDDTLAALRAAGYAPVRHSRSGDTVVERHEPRRAPIPPSYRPGRVGAPIDLVQFVKQLHAAPTKPDKADQPLPAEEDLAQYTQHLSGAERRLLAHAVQTREPVLIGYISASGRHTSRVIEPEVLVAPLLVAWCRLREDERHFLLDRITAVAPAP